ncbi:MAG: S-adenosylmethionine:tRNA ribosyltransferase-isomerase [Alphaproteobacteria bacterium]|nr:S-adenosylmethionine:tRNA ribosyltransferase-isomerase [Alphaproteobacteria bacterium]
MLHTSDFDFELPAELIASHPLERRDASRMLVIGGDNIADKHIRDFLDFLRPGDVVVFNNSRVIPARFDADGHEITLHTAVSDKNWWGLCKKFNKINVGDILTLADGTQITVMDKDEESGLLVHFNCDNVFDVLNKVGKMPLPPYMKREAEVADQTRYQTVYADPLGSMAAPTAGLHFTDELMREIEQRGAKIVKVTLHVGAGTWMPVKTENLNEHKMHSEWCQITPEQADIINNATRVIAVGTTSLRTLESAAQLVTENNQPRPCGGVAEHAQLCNAMRGRVDEHHQYCSQNIKAFAQEMRRSMTDSEKKLWYVINKKRLGFQFRRQYIIDNKYIADFVCLEKKLIIEVDGSQHINNAQDETRTQYLKKLGFNVIRFWNWDVANNLDGCLQVINDVLTNDSFEKRLKRFMQSVKPAPETADAVSTPPQGRGSRGLRVLPFCGTTDIFITPGYKFRAVDVLLTNFHLPKSTLFMLVSAFSGLDEMKAAYAHAIAEKYRFFSYGDCCLLFKKETPDEL